MPRIKEFIYNVRCTPNDLKSPYMKSFEELVGRYVLFIVGQSMTGDPMTADGTPSRAIQKYVRELKIVDLFIDILIYPFEGKGAPFNIARLNQSTPIVRICQLIYRFLKFSVKNNEANKFYVAQWIPHYFDQTMITTAQNDLKVSDTIQELITKNKSLLDTITESTIRKIIETCSKNKKDERFLQLLSSLCQCEGQAIAGSQDSVASLFLNIPEDGEEEDEDEVGEFDELLIHVEKGSDGLYRAIFKDPEILAKNNGKPLKVTVEQME